MVEIVWKVTTSVTAVAIAILGVISWKGINYRCWGLEFLHSSRDKIHAVILFIVAGIIASLALIPWD